MAEWGLPIRDISKLKAPSLPLSIKIAQMPYIIGSLGSGAVSSDSAGAGSGAASFGSAGGAAPSALGCSPPDEGAEPDPPSGVAFATAGVRGESREAFSGVAFP